MTDVQKTCPGSLDDYASYPGICPKIDWPGKLFKSLHDFFYCPPLLHWE